MASYNRNAIPLKYQHHTRTSIQRNLTNRSLSCLTNKSVLCNLHETTYIYVRDVKRGNSFKLSFFANTQNSGGSSVQFRIRNNKL